MRALTPHIGAYVELPWDERLGVTRAALASGGDGPPAGQLAVSDGASSTAPQPARSSSRRCIPPGKRPMDAEAWIRGYGERLSRVSR